MARKQHGVKQIIVRLREIELMYNQGNTIAKGARRPGLRSILIAVLAA